MSFLYREAGRVLQGVESGKASLKTLTLGRTNIAGGGKEGDQNGPKRKLYAMVSETLRYKPLLDKLVLKADPKRTLFCDENMREKGQGYVMLYEMLLGKGSIQGGGKLKRHLMQYKARLEECLVEAKLAEGLPADASNEALLPKSARRHIFPRYARVNLMTCPDGAKGVAATLRKEGFTVKIDDVVPSLLVLPAGTDLHDHAMVKDGRLVLQDKSSCFSAEALLGGEASEATAGAGIRWKGGDVIDACAAPGNKTMHAASLLSQLAAPAGDGGGNDGGHSSKTGSSKVFAFDKDPRRLALMRQRVDEAGGTGAIETHLQDFLEVDVADERFSKVTAILLDPSCSGSGIVSVPDRLHENQDVDGGGGGDEKNSRVCRLAAFQLEGLLKAMSFPQVRRVCYSTCSIHVEENEAVVAKALEQQPAPPPPPPNSSSGHPAGAAVTPSAAPSSNKGNQEKLEVSAPARVVSTTVSSSTQDTASVGIDAGKVTSGGRFKLSRCLSRWPRRGLAVRGLDENQAACMVRTDPSEDETNGFFVAVFEREGGETKKKRNRNKNKNKNRKKNKKKRKREEAEGLGEGLEGLWDVATQNVEVSGVAADSNELDLGLTVRVETNGGEETTKA